MARTEKELAQLALDVQDACNLSGVVGSFARVTQDLWEIARANNKGTEWVNQHYVSVLFADKIADLTRRDFANAYAACMAKVEGK